MQLFPFIDFDPAETHLSFAARLAHTHTGGRLIPFLNDLGIKGPDMQLGRACAVSRLCELAGVDAGLVLRNTPMSLAKATYRLRQEIISADALSNPFTGFCPACLLADDQEGDAVGHIGRRGRLSWLLKVFRTCPVHQIALTYRARKSWVDPYHEMAFRVPERAGDLQLLVDRAQSRTSSPLQDYANERLDGKRGPEWLDSQTLEQAVKATEMLGALAEFGPTASMMDLSNDDWDRAGRVGFEFTKRGESSIREALTAVQSSARRSGKQPRLGNTFGGLYRWLAGDLSKDPGDIKHILRQHICDTVEIESGVRILGTVLTTRRFHSAASLATETGLDRRTLKNVLIAKNLIPDDDLHHVFDAALGRKAAAQVARLVHVISLPKVLNCSRPQVDQLLGERIVEQIAIPTVGAVGRTRKAVAIDKVHQFERKLSDVVTMTHQLPDGLTGISKAAEKLKVPGVDIVHLVLGGYLSRVFALDETEGLDAIWIDPVEVRDAHAREMIGLAPTTVAIRLRFPIDAVWDLMEGERSVPLLPHKKLTGPRPSHSFRRIMEDDLAAFREAYVPTARLAAAMVAKDRTVEGILKGKGLHPKFRSIATGMGFYAASALPGEFRQFADQASG